MLLVVVGATLHTTADVFMLRQIIFHLLDQVCLGVFFFLYFRPTQKSRVWTTEEEDDGKQTREKVTTLGNAILRLLCT